MSNQLNLPETSQPQIQEFQFKNNPLRIVERDGELLFVAKEVCDILELGNSRQALSRLDEDEKGVILNDTLGGKQEMAAVNEFGLYSLILSSRKKSAKEFKRWVTHEVLPTIRKTGSYSVTGTEPPQIDTPSTVKDREPIRKLVNVWVGHARITFKDAWHLIHANFGVSSIEELTVSQIKPVTDWIQAHIDLALAPEPSLESYKPSAEYEARELELRALYEKFDQSSILADIGLKTPGGTLSLIFDMKNCFTNTLKVAAGYDKIMVQLQKFEADYLNFCLFRKMMVDRK